MPLKNDRIAMFITNYIDNVNYKILIMASKNMGKIIVYGAEYCNFCKKAQQLLTKNKVTFSYIDV